MGAVLWNRVLPFLGNILVYIPLKKIQGLNYLSFSPTMKPFLTLCTVMHSINQDKRRCNTIIIKNTSSCELVLSLTFFLLCSEEQLNNNRAISHCSKRLYYLCNLNLSWFTFCYERIMKNSKCMWSCVASALV